VELAHLLAAALGPAALLLATGLVVGRWSLRRLPVADPLESVALAAPVGLGVLGTGLLALGLLHLLRPDVLLGLIALVHLAAGCWWARQARAAWSAVRRATRRGIGMAVAAIAGLAPLVALALYPPTGYDATTYHLPYARAFARAHAVPLLPDRQPPIFPQLQELLFAAGLALGSDLVPQLLQLASALLVALLLVAWRASPVPAAARWWAAALWLGTPHVVWMGSAAYVDLGMALQATAAVYAWTRARREPAGSGGWWGVAGAAAGFAAASKYLGLFFVAAGLAAALRAAWTSRRPTPILAFGAAALGAAGPWYLRLYVETGNPLFPFFSRWLGAEAWDPGGDPALRGHAPALALGHDVVASLAGVGEAVMFLLQVPWNGLVHREVFDLQAPLTPYYLIALPLLLPVAAARRTTRPLVVLGLAYAALWLVTPRDLRYLLPLWPLLNLAVMDAAVALLARRWPTLGARPAVVLAVAVGLAAPGWLYAGYRLARQGPLPVAPVARDAYLSGAVPGYDAIAWLNRRHGSAYTVYALFGARLSYYAEGRLRGAWIGPDRYARVLRVVPDPVALDAELRRLDAGYLLILSDRGSAPAPETAAGPARPRLVLEGRGFALYERADRQ
jgi:hypothetical protein